MKYILLNGFISGGINGTNEITLETSDDFDLCNKFITIEATNHLLDKYPKNKWHGKRKYIINTDHIVCIWGDEIQEENEDDE